MHNNEVLATNLKHYKKLDDNAYKILVSYYFSGSSAAKENLTETDFIPAIEEMFEGELSVVPGTLVDYKAIAGNYKTCLVQPVIKTLSVSVASFSDVVKNHGFKSLSNNIFVDSATNNIWKKIVTDSGITQLVQNAADNLEELIKRRIDISEVIASARPLYALQSEKFDYAFYYNPSSKKVESGIILKNIDNARVTLASKQQRKAVEIDSHYLVTVAGVTELITQFEKELKNSKDSTEVMQAYMNFWFNSASGLAATKQIERELKQAVLKTTASDLESAQPSSEDLLQEIQTDLQNRETHQTESIKPTKEEIEVIVNTKFDKEKITNFAFVEEVAPNSFVLKFTKATSSVDELAYVLNKIVEVFGVNPTMDTTEEFVTFSIILS